MILPVDAPTYRTQETLADIESGPRMNMAVHSSSSQSWKKCSPMYSPSPQTTQNVVSRIRHLSQSKKLFPSFRFACRITVNPILYISKMAADMTRPGKFGCTLGYRSSMRKIKIIEIDIWKTDRKRHRGKLDGRTVFGYHEVITVQEITVVEGWTGSLGTRRQWRNLEAPNYCPLSGIKWRDNPG